MKTLIFFTLRPFRKAACIILFVAAAALTTLGAIGSLRAGNGSARTVPNILPGKIAPWVLEHTAAGEEAEFLVVLADQAGLSKAKQFKTKAAKGRYVRDTLWAKARSSQGPLLQWLRQHRIEHRSFYVVNVIWVKATREIVAALAARPDVLRIEGNPRIRNFQNPVLESASAPHALATVEPGIAYSHAPEVWALGVTGQGIVVGGADTGVLWDHDALKNHYRGWNGTVADHNYNWHDSLHSGGGSCGADSPFPCDARGHGTHTMGTAVGDDGGTNQVGMAPGAKWISCRNMDENGVGAPATYLECFEFFLAPYPVAGTPAEGDSSKAPDVTINSWTCPSSEGCSPDTLQAGVEAQRAAGIMTVVAAGNAGPSCSTINVPPATYDAAYSVGALLTGSDVIRPFSSRGPVTVDGSNRLKPDLVAPGTTVRSSTFTSTSSYGELSGTSMACPHVVGAIALLWSAHPTLRNDVSATETVLNESAVHLSSNACDMGVATSPNNVYGYGRLDAKAAVDHLLLISAVSRKIHGAAGTFDIPMPLTGAPAVECRSSGGNHTLVFTFDNDVMNGDADVTSGTGNITGSPTFSGKTMTVQLTGVADQQKIIVTLTGVTDTFAQVLADTPVSLNILAGDTNGNKVVNASDTSQTKLQSGAAVTATNFREDVVVTGSINGSDISLVKSQSGTSVP